MKNFDEYTQKLLKSTNFAKQDNFDAKWSIIKETYHLDEHKMLIGEVCQTLKSVYDDLEEFEIADLCDFWEREKVYGRYKKR